MWSFQEHGHLGRIQLNSEVTDQSLKHTLEFGIGIHHAGLPERDRKATKKSLSNRTVQFYRPAVEKSPGGGRALCGSQDHGDLEIIFRSWRFDYSKVVDLTFSDVLKRNLVLVRRKYML